MFFSSITSNFPLNSLQHCKKTITAVVDQHYARASEKWFCFHRWLIDWDTITFFRLWNSQDLFSPSAAHSIDLQVIAVNAVLFSNAFLTAWVDKGVFLVCFVVVFFFQDTEAQLLAYQVVRHSCLSLLYMRTRAGRLGKTICMAQPRFA